MNEKQPTEPIKLIETADETALRDLIIKSQDRKEVLVPVPEWGTTVLIRSLSGAQRSAYFVFRTEVQKNYAEQPEFYDRVLFEQIRLGCLHPKTKKPIFQHADRDALLNDHNGDVIERLAAMVREVSGLNVSAIDEAKKKLQLILSNLDTINSQGFSGLNE